MMMNVVLALLLLLQATAARPGVVTGQLQTRKGAGCRDPHLRGSGTAAKYTSVGRPELLRSDSTAGEHGTHRCAGAIPARQSRTRPLLRHRQRVRLPNVLSGTTNADGGTVITVSADTPAPTASTSHADAAGGRISGRVSPPPPAASQEKAILSRHRARRAARDAGRRGRLIDLRPSSERRVSPQSVSYAAGDAVASVTKWARPTPASISFGRHCARCQGASSRHLASCAGCWSGFRPSGAT